MRLLRALNGYFFDVNEDSNDDVEPMDYVAMSLFYGVNALGVIATIICATLTIFG